MKSCLAGGVAIGAGSFSYSWLTTEEEAAMRKSYTLQKNIQEIQGVSEDEINILFLASLAPSGHNTQPWKITIKGPKRWGISSESKRWLPAVDPDNREMMLSIGAFIENLSVAAGIQGYEAEIDVVGKDTFSPEIAEVRFMKGKETGASDRAITGRRTIRKDLLNSAIREEDVKHLIGNHKSEVFYYPLNSKEGSYLSQVSLQANKAQVNREAAQNELAEWIRWTDREAREYWNGLTPESMEMKGLIRWYAKHFLGKRDVLSKTFRNETIKLVEEQVRNCAGWLVVKSDRSTVGDLIKAGRVMQSAWLRAYEKLIAFHPMTQVLEEGPWRTQIAEELGHTGRIQFIIRIGYVTEYLEPGNW